MGRSCPFPPYNECPWQPEPEIVRSLLLFAVIASRVDPQIINAAGHGRSRSCEDAVGSVPDPGGRVIAGHPMFTYILCPAGGGHPLSGRRSHRRASLGHLLLVYRPPPRKPSCPPPPVVRLYVAGGRRSGSAGPLGGPRRRSFRQPGQAGGQVQAMRTAGTGGHRHGA